MPYVKVEVDNPEEYIVIHGDELDFMYAEDKRLRAIIAELVAAGKGVHAWIIRETALKGEWPEAKEYYDKLDQSIKRAMGID